MEEDRVREDAEERWEECVEEESQESDMASLGVK